MRILNVAEKPSVAKQVTQILSNNNYTQQRSNTIYNIIYEFTIQLNNNIAHETVTMIFTSVTGHIMTHEFQPPYDKNWNSTAIDTLFTAPVIKQVIPSADQRNHKIVQQLQNLARQCDKLILWLDCDREGENIAFEVYDICATVKPALRHNTVRAHFSALIPADIKHALNTCTLPNKNWSDAADTRGELDLRLGAIFTRLQTIQFQSKYNIEHIISWGPCQFPTLGFIVDRYMERHKYVRNTFYYITVTITVQNISCALSWQRGRLYDRYVCIVLYDILLQQPTVYITNKSSKTTYKHKPLPLSTTAMQKACSTVFHINSHRSMEIAEKLYQKGLVSYPRTETDKFKEGTDLQGLIQQQCQSAQWGQYANSLITENKFQHPRNGGHDDAAHPPIHPTKFDQSAIDALSADERKIYEFITRHFLACCSNDAVGELTTIKAEIRNTELHCTEHFTTSGLIIKQRNYLDVYTYDKWSGRVLPDININDTYTPSELLMHTGTTEPPPLLSESDLITAMDTHGIGTDATIAQHIKTVLEREYCYVDSNKRFVPSDLGLVLVLGYERMGLNMSKPFLRAHVESQLTAIANGTKAASVVKQEVLDQMKVVYEQVVEKLSMLDAEFQAKFGSVQQHSIDNSTTTQSHISKCGLCNSMMSIRQYTTNNRTKRFLYCNTCNKQLTLPDKGVLSAHTHTCPMPLDNGTICNYQVLNCLNEQTQKSHTLCPRCYAAPPTTQIEQLGDTYSVNAGFRCFSCTYKQCSLSLGTSQRPIRKCTYCNNNMILKSAVQDNSKRYYLRCTDCNATMSLNNAVDVDVTNNTCTNHCKLANGTAARLITMTVSGNMLPSHINNPVTMCVGGCDTELMTVLNLTVRQSTNTTTNTSSNTNVRNFSSNTNYSSNRNFNVSNNIESEHKEPDINHTTSYNNTNSSLQRTSSTTTNSDTCYKCGGTGHWANRCPNAPSSSNTNNPRTYTTNSSLTGSTVTCYKCKQPGHIAPNCPSK